MAEQSVDKSRIREYNKTNQKLHYRREKPDERREVIRRSYEKAKSSGEENVYFIDGQTLFDGEFYDSRTGDGRHPNHIGFMRTADKIGTVVANAMNLIK